MIRNFELKNKVVTLSVTGPRTLLNRKTYPFSRKADVNMTLLDFLKQKCDVELNDIQALEYHARPNCHKAKPGVYYSLTTSIKDFVEMNYKRKALKNNRYSMTITRKRPKKSDRTGLPVEGAQSAPTSTLEVLTIDQDDDDSDVEIGSTSENHGGGQPVAAESLSMVDSINQNPVRENRQGSSRNSLAALESDMNSELVEEEDDETPTPSTSRPTTGARGNCGGRLAGVKPEKKTKFPSIFRDLDQSSCLEDAMHEGIAYEELRPLISRNIRTLGNSYLIRLKNEVQALHKKRDKFGVSLWSKVAQRAPLCSVFMEKIFEKGDQ